MIAGFALSFLVRRAPVEFHESKWIAFITYAIVFLGLVMIILFYVAASNEMVWFVLRTLLILILVDLCAGLLFVPKVRPSLSLSSLHLPPLSRLISL